MEEGHNHVCLIDDQVDRVRGYREIVMDRDLYVSESGNAAFRISQVNSMRMQGKTHVVQMKGGDEHYISEKEFSNLATALNLGQEV